MDIEDYEWAAKELRCSINAIKAVAAIESTGDGFLENGQPKILFEAHHFSRLTGQKYDITYPNISSKFWNRKLYIGGEAEHLRLAQAINLDKGAALQSVSWGKFQIMGFNWKVCGYPNLQTFINDMYAGEFGHLKAFIGFIKADKNLQDALQDMNWAAFARLYNGSSYAVNKYDQRLARAYQKLEGSPNA